MRSDLFAETENIPQNIKKDEFLRRQLDTARRAALEGSEINSLPYSDFRIFYKSGSRSEYEDKYFAHRRILCAQAVRAAAGDDCIKELQDALWAVMDEFTWALPAHIPPETSAPACACIIDLFAAETAFTLAEILYIFGERLEEQVRERIEYEVRRRVLLPYLSGAKNVWDERENNWAAVCAGSVGAAFLYLGADEEIKKVLPRIKNTLSCYLKGFQADGACVEGINYWIYGFGYFTYFAELLYRYTNGKENLFDNPKVEAIAMFGQRVRLSNNKTVTFSDSGDMFIQRSGLSYFLAKRFEDVFVPDDSSALGFDGDACYRFAHIIRDFAWRDTEYVKKSTNESGFEYFEDAAWYIKKTPLWEFAAKAGRNNESHNHNDIGSFMININGDPVITDPGKGEYTADYFTERRYMSFAPSAAAHSVPVINGRLQCAGDEFFGKILNADRDCLVIDFTNSYDDKTLKKLVRRFEFSDGEIKMRDEFEFCEKPTEITEHFVSAILPCVSDGKIIIGNLILKCDMELYGCEISEKTFSLGHHKEKTVYLTDLHIKAPRESVSAEFTFEVI